MVVFCCLSAVLLKCVFADVVNITSHSFSKSKYIAVNHAQFPTSGVISVGPVLHCSIGQCVGACNRLRSHCRGFTFQSTTSSDIAMTGTRRFQPVAFVNPGEVMLNQADSSQRLYVISDLCSAENNPCQNAATCSMAVFPNTCTCSSARYGGNYCGIGTTGIMYCSYS